MKRLLGSLAFGLMTALVVDVLPALAQNRVQPQTNINRLDQIPGLVLTVLFAFLPAVATFYLILTGYRYIVAQGNPDLTEKAKKSLTYAVFGVIVAYVSAAIIMLFANAVGFPLSL